MEKQLITSKNVASIVSLLITFTLTNCLLATDDKTEPLGAERGKIVNVPAEAADKLGKHINELFGDKEKELKSLAP